MLGQISGLLEVSIMKKKIVALLAAIAAVLGFGFASGTAMAEPYGQIGAVEGNAVTASFTGLTPNGEVTVTADDNFVSDIVQVISRTFTADAQGNLSVKLILKDGVAPGTPISVTATDETTQTSTTATSTVPATGEGTPSGNQGQVPQTGAAIMPYAVAAVLLIAAGIAVFAARKSSARR